MKLRITIVLALLCATTASAHAASTRVNSPWYWTSGVCKSVLQSSGMQLADGRTFNVAKAFCVGKGGLKTCQWSSGHRTRLYTDFYAFARSYDGVVRTFQLRTHGKDDYRSWDIKALGREPNAQKFSDFVAPLAAALAQQELTKGCAPYSP